MVGRVAGLRQFVCYLALICTALTTIPVAEAQSPYIAALRSRPLVEGLGFEGALTVFDEIKRMHRKLGKPTVRADLYYRYEGSGYVLEVFGRYEEGRFEVAKIHYSDDEERRIRTDTGFRLGDPISRVLEHHGTPDSVEDGAYIWDSKGVTYHIGPSGTVNGITVFRPKTRGDTPRLPSVAKPYRSRPAAVRDGTPPVMTLADIQLSIPLGGWQVTTPVTESGAVFVSKDEVATIDISTCVNCEQVIIDAARDREERLGVNLLKKDQRQIRGKDARDFGVDLGYLGVYRNSRTATVSWLWALRSQGRSWLITLSVRADRPHHPDIGKALRVIQELRVVKSPPPPGN
ncbi:MAG: hypothetical protein VX223_04395 [Myxococcota bacterium]|nr:hypothetical protein [Myxococcota bacterium]